MEKDELTQVVSDVLKSANDAQLAEIEKTVDAKMEALREEIKPKNVTGGHEREDDDPKGGFKFFGEFTKALVNAATGKSNDERLTRIKAVSGMSEGADVYGGYLVPTEYRRELWKLAVETSPIINAATKIPMASNRVEVPFVDGFADRDDGTGTIHGGIRFYWLGEAEQRTASKPTLGKLGLQLHKLGGLFYATDELLSDSAVSIEPMIREMFADGMRYTLEHAFLWGSGANQPLGVMNASCLVSVAKENMQAADTIVTENVLKMYARLYRKEGAFWLVNQDVFPQLPLLSIAYRHRRRSGLRSCQRPGRCALRHALGAAGLLLRELRHRRRPGRYRPRTVEPVPCRPESRRRRGRVCQLHPPQIRL